MADEINVNQTEPNENVEQQEQEQGQNEAENAELARLKAELAKQKAAINKATEEAAAYKRQLRSKQSADEIAAEEKRLADEARDKELADLRKRFAVAEIGKKVMTLGANDQESGEIAELLYGAEDVENALTMLQKVWSAKEKALRLEFGKIPPPGVGGNEGSVLSAAVKQARDIGKAKAEADKTAQDAMKAYLR